MEIGKTLYVTNRKEWRQWLAKHYETENEIWLIYYKKHTNKPTIPYDDAVEEALCFGWIDSTVKRMDEEQYAQRYTPRNLKSVWSPYNITRVQKMIKEGKMKDSGLSKYAYGMKHHQSAPTTKETIEIPDDLRKALKQEPLADKQFNTLSKSHKIRYIYWINSAKKEPTRKRRIQKTIELLKEKKDP